MDLPVSASELAAKLQTAAAPFLLDVREPEEHAFVALPDSKLIPLGQIAERAGELDAWKDKEIVVYCHHGIRSQHAILRLRSLGFTNLRNLSGGIDAWSREVNAALPRY